MFLVANHSHTTLAQSYTGPGFRPFYGIDMIDATLTQWDAHSGKEFTTGELTDINNQHRACGWVEYEESSETYTAPFYYAEFPRLVTDASDDILYTIIGRSVLLPTNAYGHATAEGISATDTDVTYVVGSMWTNQSGTQYQAAVWTCEDDPETYSYELIPDLDSPSVAYAVNYDSGTLYVVGQHGDPGEEENTSFVARYSGSTWTIKEPHAPLMGFASDVIELDDGTNEIRVVGQIEYQDSWTAYECEWDGQASQVHPNETPYGQDWSGARAINISFNIVGWRWPSDASHRPVYWGWYDVDGSDAWGCEDVVGPPVILDAISQDLNASDEVVVSYTPDSTSGGKLWTLGTAWDIDDLAYLNDAAPDVSSAVHKLWVINDDLWIAGSYKTSNGDPRPLLLVPYDVDNDGVPDFRQIVESQQPNEDNLDEYGRQWLLDQTEQMRVGLHAPGWNGTPDPDPDCGTCAGEISNVQTVRQIIVHQGSLIEEDQVGLYEFATKNDGVHVNTCGDLAEMIEDWSDGNWYDGPSGCDDGGSQQSKEVICTIRVINPDDTNQDYIPTEADDYPHSHILYHLREMGYRLANCLDFIQVGNEHWSGSGELYIHEGLLQGQGCSGESYFGVYQARRVGPKRWRLFTIGISHRPVNSGLVQH
ncbi:MAG: hypothetical protein D8M59_08465 [Planctomycetes bacterium]|nr:hypothetical protein [Planctomycetota bacterium]NOG53971.1 hypothetical protein [Planctomycetota bacterium]